MRVRLIFTPADDPLPIKPDDSLDGRPVTAVMNLEIVDYHEQKRTESCLPH
jgi:hypothetical protein